MSKQASGTVNKSGITDETLWERALLSQDPLFFASRFTSKAIAENAINEALRTHRHVVKEWADAKLSPTCDIEYETHKVIGDGLFNRDGQVHPLTRVRLVFRRARTGPKTFYLDTSYPIPSLSPALKDTYIHVATEHARTSYPAFLNLIRGYFNQDSNVISENPDVIARVFKEDSSYAHTTEVVKDILLFLALHPEDDPGLAKLFRNTFAPEISFYHWQGRSTREGLRRLVEILMGDIPD